MGLTTGKKHRVSVVVPTRDRPALLREALASIRALEGDDLSFEILVGDNGGLPEAKAVAEEFGAVHVPADGAGAAVARNAALFAASCDYIAFLDDDDLWTADHIRSHIALLEARPDLDMAVGQIVNTDTARRPTYGPWPPSLPEQGRDVLVRMLSGYFPQIGATMVRARVRDTVGGFDPSLIGDQDWDWQIRVARRHGVGFVERVCVLFRQRPTGAFDALQQTRVRYTRKVFFRHALAEWRLWRSPVAFVRAYFGAVSHYFIYFVTAAELRLEQADRKGAAAAVLSAFGIFPSRAVRWLASPTPLRRVVAGLLSSRARPASDAAG